MLMVLHVREGGVAWAWHGAYVFISLRTAEELARYRFRDRFFGAWFALGRSRVQDASRSSIEHRRFRASRSGRSIHDRGLAGLSASRINPPLTFAKKLIFQFCST